MATVVLENDQKATILKDINDFLHPRTARWYSNRGIPYRRGYLFHGPPGTGKTSLSFAIAGVFGLDIYCLALSEISLTEEDLILLFNSLPKRCIVLLEDIDSAGITGKSQPGSEQQVVSSLNSAEIENGTDPVVDKKLKKPKGSKHSKPLVNLDAFPKPNSITLSGLLNAIDGVASQEGRVLILTTNHPEQLSEALIRPGRVDLQVKFDLANKQQIRDLFLRMYYLDPVEIARQPTRISQILPKETEPITQTNPPHVETKTPYIWLSIPAESERVFESKLQSETAASTAETRTSDDLQSQPKGFDNLPLLATAFMDALPDLTFSPAEIQGFLLMRKHDPEKAVLDVIEWRDSELAKKWKMQDGSLSEQYQAENSENINEYHERHDTENAILSSTNHVGESSTWNATNSLMSEELNPSNDNQQQIPDSSALELDHPPQAADLPAGGDDKSSTSSSGGDNDEDDDGDEGRTDGNTGDYESDATFDGEVDPVSGEVH